VETVTDDEDIVGGSLRDLQECLGRAWRVLAQQTSKLRGELNNSNRNNGHFKYSNFSIFLYILICTLYIGQEHN